MHLGRFHKVINELNVEFHNVNYESHFNNLINSLNTVASQPANSDLATSYKNQLESFRSALFNIELNFPRPGTQAMLASIDAEKYIGNRLFNRVMDAISANPATPSLAAQAVQNLRDETIKFYKNIATVDSVFAELEVEYESLDYGEGELGILIPRDDNSSTLTHLSKEFKDWHNILSPLSEIFDHDAAPLRIRTCATTDWVIYLATTFAMLQGVSECLKAVNVILKEIIEMRSLIEQISKKSTSDEAIKMLEADSKNKLKSDLRTLSEKLVDENYKGTDLARKNELKNAVDVALKTIAKKISDGVKIELKYIAPERPESIEGEAEHNQNILQTQQEALELQLDQEISLIDFSDSTSQVQALLENEGNDLQQN